MRYAVMVLSGALACAGCDDGADGGDPVADAMIDRAVMEDARVDAGLEDGAMPDATPPDAALSDEGVADECEAGMPPTCVGRSTQQACVEEDGRWVLRETECEAGCLLGVCATDVQQRTARQIQSYVLQVRNGSGHPFPADYSALSEAAVRVMLRHDDPQEGLVRAAVHFNRSLGHGHQAITFGENAALCGSTTGYAYQAQTFYAGVCGAPLGDGVLVMSAPDGNALGLQLGDVVVATNLWPAGPTFLDDIAASPACMTRQGASEASDRAEAAATLFGKIDAGMVLTVRGPDGAERMIDVPARQGDIEGGQDFCLDPFGGYDFVEAELTIRDDGVAVIRNSTLRPEQWDSAESYLEHVQEMIDRIGAVVAMVPDGAPIIWDIRGNSGGSAEVALGVVAGMPGARSVEVSRGYFRIANSNPPEWEAQPHPFQSYSMTVDDGLSTNHRDHPVAVLVDGKTVSAADYFAYAAAEFTDALIVGPEGTAGAFGFGGQPFSTVSGPVIPLQHRVDPLRVETPEGEFLERRSVMPDMVVPYDPSDVAQGVDTVLEAAAAALLAQ